MPTRTVGSVMTFFSAFVLTTSSSSKPLTMDQASNFLPTISFLRENPTCESHLRLTLLQRLVPEYSVIRLRGGAEVGKGDPRWIVKDREDGKNVNSWHWEERDMMPFARFHVCLFTYFSVLIFARWHACVKMNLLQARTSGPSRKECQ